MKPDKKELIEIQERCLPKERYEEAMKYMPCLDDDQHLAMRQDSMRKGFDMAIELYEEHLKGLLKDTQSIKMAILDEQGVHLTDREITAIITHLTKETA